MKKTIALIAVSTISLLMSIPGQAQDKVSREHHFELEDIDVIEINNSVGSLDISFVAGNELSVELELEGQRHGFFRGYKDVSDVDLEVEESRERLRLTIDDDDVTAHWVIRMPAVSRIEIDQGVGEIDIEDLTSSLEINMGVGDVYVEASRASTGNIEVSSGVGDARIRGIENVRRNRHVVAEESEGYADGDNPIDIEVGVGSATIRLY